MMYKNEDCLLKVQKLSIELPDQRKLLEDLSLSIMGGDRLVLIGEEGNGKSTLLKLIAGLNLENDIIIKGEIERKVKIGYLPQYFTDDEMKMRVIDFGREVADYKKWMRWVGKFELVDLVDAHDRKISELSGGERVKFRLAKLLSADPKLLLWDEPTNDLDLQVWGWMENFMLHFDGAIIFVSHDEYVIDKIANRVVHLEQIHNKTKSLLSVFNGSWSEYVRMRELTIERQNKKVGWEKRVYDAKKNKLLRQKSTVRSQQDNIKDCNVRRLLNKKMKNILSQEKKLNRIKTTDFRDREEGVELDFRHKVWVGNSRIVLDLKNRQFILKNNCLKGKNINLSIVGPTKVAIVGKNGVGKTTLLKLIEKYLVEHTNWRVGYFPQDYNEVLDNEQVVYKWLIDKGKEENIEKILSMLGQIKFTKKEMNDTIGYLSEGQKAKLIWLMLTMSPVEILLLDEPTRNLSVLTCPVIRELLKNFGGAIIAVSHDRKFVHDVADEVYVMSDTTGLRYVDKQDLI